MVIFARTNSICCARHEADSNFSSLCRAWWGFPTGREMPPRARRSTGALSRREYGFMSRGAYEFDRRIPSPGAVVSDAGEGRGHVKSSISHIWSQLKVQQKNPPGSYSQQSCSN
ncbi:hypothetical protein MCOR31_005873 [Pyricularia oryzae]|uniref:Uncharacterized protein n=2 Tax=Pyricularia TaxID=48558 RepID=A0A4P7NWB9_PYROR|nr:hypothetical protein MCOR01_009531 [Pyricularia oryzae]KAI6286633.1 hypothetical protein MCOR26_001021 [Pyricularia oryzae]KAI6330943.1 hypothetical protein MCOR28_011515 [Pyricularia oryzae]KAI6367818.1 hypothetical protein MCOR31_005873 [Pyricularia oryzae]KAI6470661.1 hypothetical protein MCOR15_001259 [Pyricularia oryzae]